MRQPYRYILSLSFVAGAFSLLMLASCKEEQNKSLESTATPDTPAVVKTPDTLFTEPFANAVRVGRLFHVIDSLSVLYDSLTGDSMSEHILVAANPWIIDTRAATQYETFMSRDSFVYDQQKLIVIPAGTRLIVPDSAQVKAILSDFAASRVNLNVPEYKLRIIRGADTLLDALCRVGRNEYKYLELAKTKMWLKTDTGTGTICRIEKAPLYLNPVDGKKFTLTKRDDYRTTLMPLIPWIEPCLNGTRYGDLIHPTTNPKTLGKAYSNGCIGLSEADAWRFYYFAPLGTQVHVYYKTEVITPHGDTIHYKDIYHPAWARMPAPVKQDTARPSIDSTSTPVD